MRQLFIILSLVSSFAFSETHRSTPTSRLGVSPKDEEPSKECTDFQINAAKKAIKLINASSPNWGLDSYMSGTPSAKCPTIASHCFAHCVGTNTANAALCKLVCKLSSQPANCNDEVQLKAAVGALEACSGAGVVWQCLDEFMIYENKIAFCPGVSDECTGVCAKRHPGSVDCGRVCNKPPRKEGVARPTIEKPRPRPVPPSPPLLVEGPVEICRKKADPISCDNDKRCRLVGAGVVRRGLGGPAFTCCAEGSEYSKQCEQDIIRNSNR